MLPNVSIVIPGYNCSHTIAETVRACLEQDYPQELLEIIFVDDGSKDNPEEIVGRFPVKYIRQEHSGPAKARNRGWKEAKGEIVLFTDSDCVPKKNWVISLVKNFTHGKIGAVGGSYEIKNPKNILADCIHAEIKWRHHKMPREVNVLGSYNLAVRKELLIKLNGFNESYLTSSGEDFDLCYRLVKKGYVLVFEPNALVYHYYPERIFSYLKHQFWHGYWRVKLYRDHFKMIKGDNYSGFLDYFPPILAISFAFFPLLLIELYRNFKIFCYTKKIEHLIIFGVFFLRDFWRGSGLLFGFVNIFIIKKYEDFSYYSCL